MADFSNAGYGSINPFPNGQCTWYAWGRAYEVCGVKLAVYGNACDWYDNVDTSKFARIDGAYEPKAKYVAVFNNYNGTGPFDEGHVVFVESITGSGTNKTVKFSEANGPKPDGTIISKSLSEFRKLYGYHLKGYIKCD